MGSSSQPGTGLDAGAAGVKDRLRPSSHGGQGLADSGKSCKYTSTMQGAGETIEHGEGGLTPNVEGVVRLEG